jgi:hypothetical protein
MTTETADATTSGRWALWGTAAGVLGLVTNVLLSRTIDYTKGLAPLFLVVLGTGLALRRA